MPIPNPLNISTQIRKYFAQATITPQQAHQLIRVGCDVEMSQGYRLTRLLNASVTISQKIFFLKRRRGIVVWLPANEPTVWFVSQKGLKQVFPHFPISIQNTMDTILQAYDPTKEGVILLLIHTKICTAYLDKNGNIRVISWLLG